MKNIYILFDIGGTNMRLGVANNKNQIVQHVTVPTPFNYQKAIQQLSALIHASRRYGKIKAIAGGVPGPLNKERTKLVTASNLPHWAHKPFAKDLATICKVPVLLENDAVLAGLGEAHFGAGKGYTIIAYYTVSTGVGGARIVYGRPDVVTIGFEPGHQIIDMAGTVYPTARPRGELESYISGNAIEKRYSRAPKTITTRALWKHVAEHLAVGVHNSIVHWSPECVVLGGSMFRQPGIKLIDVQIALRKISHIFPRLPRLKRAALGDSAGLHGALALLGLTQ